MTKVTISPESESLILAAAEEVFRAKGFKRGTVRDISQRCEMSVGAVASIGPKEQLLIRVMENKIAAAQRLPQASIQADGATAAAAIIRQLGSFFDLFETEWPLASEYAAVLASGRFQSTLFADLAQDLISGFSAVIADGRGAEDSDSVRETAAGIYLAYLGSLYLWTSQGVGSRATCEKQLATTIRLLLE